MELRQIGPDTLDSVKALKAAPVLALGGIFSGLFEGQFLLESLFFPLIAVLLSWLLIARGYEDLSLLVSCPSLIYLSSMYLAPVDLAALLFPVAVSGLTVYSSPEKVRLALMVVTVQLMDAISTVSVLHSGGSEKVLLSAFFLEIAGYTGLFMLKALVLMPYLIYSVKTEDTGLLDFLVYSAGIILVFHNLAL